MKEQWNQGYAPRIQPCDTFDAPIMVEGPDGSMHQICPTTGVFYAPPLSAAALTELLFPSGWSLFPPNQG